MAMVASQASHEHPPYPKTHAARASAYQKRKWERSLCSDTARWDDACTATIRVHTLAPLPVPAPKVTKEGAMEMQEEYKCSNKFVEAATSVPAEKPDMLMDHCKDRTYLRRLKKDSARNTTLSD